MNRREFLATTAGAVVHAALPQDNVDAIFDRTIVFDSLSADQDWEAATFEAAKVSGLSAIQTSLGNRNLAVAMKDLAEWDGLFGKHPERLRKVVRGADFAAAKERGQIAVVLGFQNATIVESSVGNVDKLHAAGARCIQLTYNSRNLLGDGCTERTNAGLSDFGVEVVHRMNELGIVVDLSHCGEQTSRDGIELSKRAPAFTHTVCKGIYDHVRGKSDELIRAISNKGGITGITTLGYFLGPTPQTSLDDYFRQIDHAVKVGGIDHVGIASDYAIRGIMATHTRESWYLPRLKSFKPIYNVRWPPNVPELDPPTRYRTIARGLSKRGYNSERLEKILGRNWVRYFSEVMG